MINFSRLKNASCLPVCLMLKRSNICSSREYQSPLSEEDNSYLTNLFGPALEEELVTLAQYTEHAFVALSLGRVCHWNTFALNKNVIISGG